MSLFLALTLKSSKKSAFWTLVNMCGEILEFQKICMFQAKIWRWHTTRRCFGKVCPLGCSEKVFIFSPFLSLCQKPRKGEGEERSHFHDHNSLLVLPFLLFGFVLVTR